MFWRVSDEEREIIFREKIKSNIAELQNSQKKVGRLKQQVDELSGRVNIQELQEHDKDLRAEKSRLSALTKQYEEQLHFWHKRLSVQNDLEEKYNSIKQEVETLQKQELRWKREIEEMKSQERDPMEMEHELKQVKSQKKALTRKNKELQKKVENFLRKIPAQDRLSGKLRMKQEKYAELLRRFLQEATEQLCKIDKKQRRDLRVQTAGDISRSSETSSQLANDREKELLQQISTSQRQLTILKGELECLKATSSLKETYFLKENGDLKDQLEEAQQHLRLKGDTMTKTVCRYKDKLSVLRTELAVTTARMESDQQTRVKLEEAVETLRRCLQEAVTEAEQDSAEKQKALLEKQHLMVQLAEKESLLEAVQREKEQADVSIKQLETSVLAEREQLSLAEEREKATRDQLAQTETERTVLLQQLAKESAVHSQLETENKKLRDQLRDEHQQLEERLTTEAPGQCKDSSSLSEALFRAQINANEVRLLRKQVEEKQSQLEALQQEKEQADVSIKQLETSALAEREASKDQLARIQKERTVLLQQLERETALRGQLDTENKNLQDQLREDPQCSKIRLTAEAVFQRGAASSRSQTPSRLEKEVRRLRLQLTEKGSLLEALQQEKNQADVSIKELETSVLAEKEQVSRVRRRQKATQDQLAQLRQQLKEANSRSAAKEHDTLFKRGSDWEEKIQVVEQRNEELTRMVVDLKGQISELEEEKMRREETEPTDSIKTPSMDKPSLEVSTHLSSDLEHEKNWPLRHLEQLKRELSSVMATLDEKEKHLGRRNLRMKNLEKQLELEASLRSQMEWENKDLRSQLASLRSHDQLARVRGRGGAY